MRYDFRGGLGGIRLREISVDIIEEADFLDSEYGGSRSQLSFPGSPNHLEARTVVVIAVPAPLASGSGDETGLYALGAVFGQSAAHPQRFVIGMSKHAHQLEIFLQVLTPEFSRCGQLVFFQQKGENKNKCGFGQVVFEKDFQFPNPPGPSNMS
jgi:hypothetical protein